MNLLFGGIEAGGTKFHCIVADADRQIIDKIRIDTADPETTVGDIIKFFAGRRLAAAGLACFGPVDIDRHSPTYGYITNTPKKAWIRCNILGMLKSGLGVPIGFHTDVVGAAIAESRWGAAVGRRGVLYITVGTGIGGGFVYDGIPHAGTLHGELGHIYIPRDGMPGVCPYHGDCLEGIASGPAIARRAGAPAEALPPDHAVWQTQARYLALAIVNFLFTLTPDIVVLGGGVMHAPGLLERVRGETARLIGNYGQFGGIAANINDYIVRPALGDDAGALGAAALAMDAAKNSSFRES
ncbi:MAG: ROK family protein [Planctomycetes bacterium]|nr:ROK family protein [Planctomycetota bacterium]